MTWPREWSWGSSQLILLGRFILPALSLPDTRHRPGKRDPKLCCITALAFLSTRTGTRGDLPGGLCFSPWLGSPGRQMHKTLVIWEALGCSSPYRVCPAAFEQTLVIMKGLSILQGNFPIRPFPRKYLSQYAKKSFCSFMELHVKVPEACP